MANEFRLPDGTWSCIRDGVTEPCGDCGGCRQIAAINAMHAAVLGDIDSFSPLGVMHASNDSGIHEIMPPRGT